jgi:hypothetical protein
MAHFGPDEAIARIADWKDKDVRWEELGGGITNHNYIVLVNGGPGNPGGGKYVLARSNATAWSRSPRPAWDPRWSIRSTPRAPW